MHQQELSDNYRGELNVYRVIKGQMFLQILKLLHMFAVPGLHHILKVKHSWLPAVEDDHRSQFWESKEDFKGQRFIRRSFSALLDSLCGAYVEFLTHAIKL
ncbi:hypothetical protein XENOCAPTIV_018892 [Xenoophorus captivus]|uniref:Uncharacterized protein n=1 Tax=Xenoophorus captivus TaxID=1517983 RepID=A0ABV0SG50_9TELE